MPSALQILIDGYGGKQTDKDAPTITRPTSEFRRVASGLLTERELIARDVSEDPVEWTKRYAVSRFLESEYKVDPELVLRDPLPFIEQYYGKDKSIDDAYNAQSTESGVDNPIYAQSKTSGMFHELDKYFANIFDGRKKMYVSPESITPAEKIGVEVGKALKTTAVEGSTVVQDVVGGFYQAAVFALTAKFPKDDDKRETAKSFERGLGSTTVNIATGVAGVFGMDKMAAELTKVGANFQRALAPSAAAMDELEQASGSLQALTTEAFWTVRTPELIGGMLPLLGAGIAVGATTGGLGYGPWAAMAAGGVTSGVAETFANVGESLTKMHDISDQTREYLDSIPHDERKMIMASSFDDAAMFYAHKLNVSGDPKVAGKLAHKVFNANILSNVVLNTAQFLIGGGTLGKMNPLGGLAKKYLGAKYR